MLDTNKKQSYTFKSIISYLWSRLATVLDSICPIIKLLQVPLLIIYIYYFNHDEWYQLAYYKMLNTAFIPCQNKNSNNNQRHTNHVPLGELVA